MYGELRGKALASSRKAFGLPPGTSPTEAWGVLMDVGFREGGSFTTVALMDGNASIYLSSGGGFIGGYTHETVNKAARAMVAAAAKYQPEMRVTAAYPLPTGGETIFYVLTDAGVYTASASEQDLGEQTHPLYPLFYAGQEVITQYRLIQQAR